MNDSISKDVVLVYSGNIGFSLYLSLVYRSILLFFFKNPYNYKLKTLHLKEANTF